MKHLIIGEVPNKRGEYLTLVGVARLLEMSSDDLRAVFDRINVFPRWLGPVDGDWWDPTEARRIVRTLRRVGYFGSQDYPRRRVILTGKRVMRSFDIKTEYFRPEKISSCGTEVEIVVAPHFSENNTWWNESNNRRVAARCWRQWYDDARKDR